MKIAVLVSDWTLYLENSYCYEDGRLISKDKSVYDIGVALQECIYAYVSHNRIKECFILIGGYGKDLFRDFEVLWHYGDITHITDYGIFYTQFTVQGVEDKDNCYLTLNQMV